MIEESIEIRTADGTADGFFYRPGDGSRRPGVIHLEAIDRLGQALTAWGGRYESEVYDGARHGWTVPDSPVFNGPQAERAFARLTGLLAETLRPGTGTR